MRDLGAKTMMPKREKFFGKSFIINHEFFFSRSLSLVTLKSTTETKFFNFTKDTF